MNELDVEPVSVPSQTWEFTLGEPETDFEAVFEEDEPEERSETVITFKEKARYRLAGTTNVAGPYPDYDGEEVFGFQRLLGGYKLYQSEDATRRQFFRLLLELPTSLFEAGNVITQWISWTGANEE